MLAGTSFWRHRAVVKGAIVRVDRGFAIMTGAEAGKAALCTSCGTALAGKFCSGCGAPAEDSSAIDHREGWSSLTA